MLSVLHWFVSLFLPCFKRDSRLKKRSKCPSWRGDAPVRPHCQGRGVSVHRSEAQSLDGSGAGFSQEGQRDRKKSQEELCERAVEAAKLPGAGIGPKLCPGKCAAEKG